MSAIRFPIRYTARMVFVAVLAGLTFPAQGETPTQEKAKSVTPLIERMAGTWKVEQRMWSGPDAKPVQLSQAVARRQIRGSAFLEETMEPSGSGEAVHFVRMAYVSFNPVNQQYEYFSLDTRAPQMMSYTTPGANSVDGENIELKGGTFVAQEWGDAKSVPFVYRLSIGAVKNGQQVLRLFLTQQIPAAKEFLAFEYVYTQER